MRPGPMRGTLAPDCVRHRRAAAAAARGRSRLSSVLAPVVSSQPRHRTRSPPVIMSASARATPTPTVAQPRRRPTRAVIGSRPVTAAAAGPGEGPHGAAAVERHPGQQAQGREHQVEPAHDEHAAGDAAGRSADRPHDQRHRQRRQRHHQRHERARDRDGQLVPGAGRLDRQRGQAPDEAQRDPGGRRRRSRRPTRACASSCATTVARNPSGDQDADQPVQRRRRARAR